MQTCPSTPEPLQVLVQAKDHTPREQQTVVRPEAGEREGNHILPHISERKRSRTHTYAPPLRDRAAQAKHDAGTWITQISPKPELAKLTVKCCRTRLLHLAPHVFGSAGVQQASERVRYSHRSMGVDDGAWMNVEGLRYNPTLCCPPSSGRLRDRLCSLPGWGLAGRPVSNAIPAQHR